VTDSEPDAIFIIDAEGRYQFANRAAATLAGAASPAEIVGKTIAAVHGPESAKRHRLELNRMRAQGQPITSLTRLTTTENQSICLLSTYSPLDEAAGHVGAALVVERDISAEIGERERREQTLRNLVRALITIIDRRDPYAADHSVRVGRLSRAIAEEMGLAPVLAETAEYAGNLMNLGKLLVPAELLTRSSALTDDERQRVRESLKAGADVLKGIAFDGPLVETLRQMQEHWDGTGKPDGLRGEAILITARIVSVANAFVAMISTRAYRAGIDIDVALDSLLAECGVIFDRRVVAALISYIDSRGGRAAWAAKPAAG
jgi:PAS domain S-box-containing protein